MLEITSVYANLRKLRFCNNMKSYYQKLHSVTNLYNNQMISRKSYCMRFSLERDTNFNIVSKHTPGGNALCTLNKILYIGLMSYNGPQDLQLWLTT